MRAAEVLARTGDSYRAFEFLKTLPNDEYFFDSALLRNLHSDARWDQLIASKAKSRAELDALDFEIVLPTTD